MLVEMRHLLLILALIEGPSTAFASDPELAIAAPKRLPAWGTGAVKVVVRNTTGRPIVPLALDLASDAGTLRAWGVHGSCRGDVHGCSIELRWAVDVPARKRGAGWELLLGGPPAQQRVEPPDSLSQDATERMLRLEPIAAGETVELEVPLVAMYQHGGKLAATLRYVIADPKMLPLCSAARPVTMSFVPCRRVTVASGDLYVDPAAAAKAQRTLEARVTFTVDHPAFDVADARAISAIAAGPYAYDHESRRWILVDGERTVVVGADRKLQELPGDWRVPLVELATAPVTTYWNAVSADDARRVAARMKADHLDLQAFAFKGHTSDDRFLVTFRPGEVPKLAKAMRALGYRMTDSGIVPR